MTGEIVIERFDVLGTRSDGSVMATACLDVSTVAFLDLTGTTMPLGYVPEAQHFELRFDEEHGALHAKKPLQAKSLLRAKEPLHAKEPPGSSDPDGSVQRFALTGTTSRSRAGSGRSRTPRRRSPW